VFDTGDEVGAQTFDRPCELEIRHPAHHFFDHHAQLEPREVRADTKMLAVAEGEMFLGIRVMSKTSGCGKIGSSRFADAFQITG
jgi:hypothetical protein